MSCAETKFLKDLFSSLAVEDVRYAVARNAQTLPETLGGSDLDIIALDDTEASKVYDIARLAAERHGGRCIDSYRVEVIVASFGGRNVDGEWWGCHIDIIPGVKYYGIPYMDAGLLLSERELVKNSFFKCGPIADVATLLKELVRNRRTKKDYYPAARKAYAANRDGIRNSLVGLTGERGWRLIENLLSKERNGAFIRRQSFRFTRQIWLHNLINGRCIRLIGIKAKNIYRRLRRMFFPPGFTVAFLGTDGSGKSTLIEVVKEPLEKMLHAKVHYEHLRPNMLPSLARLAGNPVKEGPTTNPHGGKVAGWISSLVRFAYYYMDYVVGYWLKIYPILVKRPSMVFFDRYYYEYMIDPRRCAIRLPRGWAKFWSRFIPKPDLILCLGGDPEKIYTRKPETSLEEVRRQVGELKKFCDGNKRAVWIDTTTNIEASRDAALMAITERMAARYK